MYIAILGRQASLSMAELERRFGADNTRWFSPQSATIRTSTLSIEQLGGTLKAGKVVLDVPRGNWRHISEEIVRNYSHEWSGHDGKITLGISVYGYDAHPRDVQKTGLIIKKNLKKSGTSLRLIPNSEPALNTATSHHNKLGLSPHKVELLIIHNQSGRWIVAESTGAQNITALAARDQARPKRDAFVGMLPPKLALLMTNLAAGKTFEEARNDENTNRPRLLDPFCGTGVVLQEAALLGYDVYGTDLSDKMIDYSKINLDWLRTTKNISFTAELQQGDAMAAQWQQPIDLIVSETYLGQPFSAPPSPKKLEEVRGNVNHITSAFLKNLRTQIASGTPLCLAIPAWRNGDGRIDHLPLTRSLKDLGYNQVELSNVKPHELLYYREDQVVARELLILVAA